MNKVKRFLCSTQCHRGAAAITAVLFFVIISVVFVLGLSSPVVRDYTTARDLGSSKSSYYLSESGLEDSVYRIKKGITISATEVLSLAGSVATTSNTDISPTEKEITSAGSVSSNARHTSTVLSKTTGVSFFYGMQVGDDGLELRDDAVVNGSVYSNGNVTGDSLSGHDDRITGDLIVAGTKDIDSAYINGTARADAITNSYIGGDAYYLSNITGSTVSGTQFPGSPNQPTTSFVITDEMIALWEAAAAAGGTTTCSESTYNITGSVTLGPRKFARSGSDPCTLVVGSGDVLTLAGPIWVKGGITINGTGQVKVSPTLPGQSVALISDNSADYNEGNRVRVEDNVTFTGAGANSYITLISMGRSTTEPAIYIWDNVNGDVITFAPDGQINITGNTHVKEVTAKKVRISGTAVLDYDTGLESLMFNSGAMGAWEVQDWKLGQ